MAERLEQMAGTSTGSSTRVKRITVLSELPSIDGNEITDKGSINQRAVMARRADIMESLYVESPEDHVISL
jgi:feruloyl-CoA synthase